MEESLEALGNPDTPRYPMPEGLELMPTAQGDCLRSDCLGPSLGTGPECARACQSGVFSLATERWDWAKGRAKASSFDYGRTCS